VDVKPPAVTVEFEGSNAAPITSSAILETGQDLTLSAGNLDLSGQLLAGGDLTLQAQDTIRIRDSITAPFIAAAGSEMLVQGNQSLDIFALNHPQAAFQSGGDLSLISNGNISGDAHFVSGGDFSVLNLSGLPGNFVSLYDPIISSNSDVNLGHYTGVALKVEAKGSIAGGDIRITGPDLSGTIPLGDPHHALLTSSSALVLQAGKNALDNPDNLPQLGIGGTTFISPGSLSSPGSIVVGDIDTSSSFPGGNGGPVILAAVGDITTGEISSKSQGLFGDGGNISLTSTAGDIVTEKLESRSQTILSGNGGAIAIVAAGDITTEKITSFSNVGNGGQISLTSHHGSIDTMGGELDAGSGSGNGETITLAAAGDITTQKISSGSIAGNGGKIHLTSDRGKIDTTGGELDSTSFLGNSGAIMLDADRNITTGEIISFSPDSNGGPIEILSHQGSIDTTSGTLLSGSVSGNGGAINLTTHQGNITSRDLVSATLNQGGGNVSTGSGGAITMNANGNIAVGFANSSSTAISEGVGGSGTAGSGGDIRMRANGSLSTGNLISWSSATASETATAGSGGNIHLSANGNISTTGLDASALTLTPAVSDLVSIQSLADSSELLPAALASVRSGNGGNLTLHSSGHLSLQGRAIATGGVGGPGISGVLPTGDGGTVDFRAGGNLTLAPSVGIIEVSGRSGGRIDLHSNQAIAVTDSFISSNSAGNGKGKGIHLVAPFIFIQGGRNGSTPLNSRTFGTGKAGDFTIDTNHLRLQGTRIAASTSSSGPSGRLTVNATNLVELSDGSSLKSQSFGSGVAGDITVNTKQLKLRGGSRISAATFDAGQGGNIIVNASDLVDLSGFLLEPDNRLEATRFDAGTAGSGAGGNITVNTRKLLVSEGAAIYTGSTSLSQGRGGTTTINALESVELRGTALAGALSSGLISDSPGGGDGGNIQVNTRRLTVRDGATISSSTLRQGEGGTVDINASETVELQGTAPDGRPSGIFSLAGTAGVSQMFLEQALREFPEEELIIFDAEDFANLPADFALRVRPTLSELLSDQPAATGQGGDVNIRTERLTVQEGAQVGVSGQFADLDAGNINIESRSILLDRGSIVAETASGEGGNINLWVRDVLLLRHGSQISTTAGTAQAGGNGGNITIDAGFVVAVPGENSDITANAFTGNGGNIRIRTNGIFGLGFRPHLTPLSDITASSEFGVDGTFTLDLLVPVDVSRGLGNLPQEQKPAELDRGCYGKGGRGSTELYDIGRGGIAAGPEEPLEGNALEWVGQTIDSEKMDSEAEEVQTAAAQAGDSRHEVAQLSTEELRPPCRRRSQPEDL